MHKKIPQLHRFILIKVLAAVALPLLFIAGCGQSEVDIRNTVERNGLRYEVNAAKPYSGLVYDQRSHVTLVATYKKGYLHGEYTEYHANEQIAQQGNYADGQKNGVWIKYDNAGNITEQCKWKNGQKDGTEIHTGRTSSGDELKTYECTWRNGKKNGLEVTHSIGASGQYDQVLKINWKDDVQDGEALLYQGENLIQRDIFRDGKHISSERIPLPAKAGDLAVPDTRIIIPKAVFENAMQAGNREKGVQQVLAFSNVIENHLLLQWGRESQEDRKKAADFAMRAYTKRQMDELNEAF